jgi:uncharacterized protein (TIGR02001 family)
MERTALDANNSKLARRRIHGKAFPQVMARAGWSAALLLLAGSPAAAESTAIPTADDAQHGLSLVLGAASEYAAHGLARSLGEPVLNAQLGYGFGSGWQAAARGSTMNLNRGPGPSRELALYLGRHRALNDDWQLGASISRYAFWQNVRGFSYDYTEATLEAEWRSMLRLRLQYSPDYSIFFRGRPVREFRTLTGEAQFSYALHRSVLGTVALGYYDLSDGIGKGYFFWSAGAVATRGRASFALSYVQVDAHAKELFSRPYTRNKLIASLAWRVH